MTEFKWTERVVATAVAHHFGTVHNLVLPNYANGLARHEADLVIVRPSGWADEVEIKVSQADYRAEFRAKPMRHRILQEGIPEIVLPPSGYREDELTEAQWMDLLTRPYVTTVTHGKHVSYAHDWSRTKPHECRRFWFAMPTELVEKLIDEIPEYAGIIAVTQTYYGVSAREVRKAPNLKNAKKIEPSTRSHILKCAYHRYWDTRPLSEKQTA